VKYMKQLWLLIPFIPSAVTAAPFVASDPTAQIPAPTACGIYLDAMEKEVIAVATDPTGKPYCRYDLAKVTAGAHTVAATYIVTDPQWGTRESAKSSPFSFTAPSVPLPPSSLKLTN
jgi:hypothetical protein